MGRLIPFQMPFIDETEKAYWAGFFDGEGSLRIKKERKGQYVLMVTLTNTDIINRARLQELGAYILDLLPQKDGNKSYWMAQFQGKKAIMFLKVILPYLRMKQGTAKIAIEFQAAKQSRDFLRQEGIYRLLLTGYPQKGWGPKSKAYRREATKD